MRIDVNARTVEAQTIGARAYEAHVTVAGEDEGGDSACWMHRVCQHCGRLADSDPPTRCPDCGSRIAA